MKDITLENVDLVRERTRVSYMEAKEALEYCDGEVLEAIIYIEDKSIKNNESLEEFKNWLKGLIEKGNVSRIKIKKDEKILVDIPVNAGVAATVIAVIVPQILAFGVIAALATKITVEITKTDGSVEVINRYVSDATAGVKEKVSFFTDKIKEKYKGINSKMKEKEKEKEKVYKGDETVYSYTVNFEEENEKKKNDDKE